SSTWWATRLTAPSVQPPSPGGTAPRLTRLPPASGPGSALPTAAKDRDLSQFLTDHGVVVALVCAAVAVLYGALTARSLLALSPGNEQMRSISNAVQEWARAYLNRQYTTVAAVGVTLAIALILVQDGYVALGFV